MGMRKLEMELKGDVEEATNKISNVDIKLLEKISMRAADYLNDRHGLYIRDYQIIFKVAEIFFDELISYIKVNPLADETITVFDQFTIVMDENSKFESIEISSYMKELISNIYMSVIEEIDKLEAEDDAFAESKIK
jgi:succinyl-CoA synthetase beta subunit